MDQLFIQNGQVVIPSSLLTLLKLHEGDPIFLSFDGNEIHLSPKKKVSLMELDGFLPKPEKSLTVEEMNEIIQGQFNDRS